MLITSHYLPGLAICAFSSFCLISETHPLLHSPCGPACSDSSPCLPLLSGQACSSASALLLHSGSLFNSIPLDLILDLLPQPLTAPASALVPGSQLPAQATP